MVGQRVYTSRDAARHSRGSGTSVYRCVRVGMGRPPSHTPGEWCLVDEGDKTPHQSIGNDGCTKRLDGLQETVDRYDSATHVRQRYRRVIPAKTGRHSISVSLPSSTGSAVTSTRRTDYYSGQAYPGGEECIGGSSLAKRQDHSHGMDPSPVCCECTVHHMGQTEHRPVRYTPEPPASGVRVSHGRPTISGCRRIINSMEGSVCLCIPPIRDAGASTRESTTGSSLRNDSNRPQVAQSVLVRQTDGVAGRLSFGPAPQERPTDPIPQPPETPVTPSSVSTRLEAVQRSLQTRGFSQTAAVQISQGHRQSSRAVYDSKWKIFAGWCTGQSIDPFQVSVPQLADFLVYLFKEKGLNPRTIKGYRSAISSTISYCGSRTEFANSAELCALIRSFQI